MSSPLKAFRICEKTPSDQVYQGKLNYKTMLHPETIFMFNQKIDVLSAFRIISQRYIVSAALTNGIFQFISQQDELRNVLPENQETRVFVNELKATLISYMFLMEPSSNKTYYLTLLNMYKSPFLERFHRLEDISEQFIFDFQEIFQILLDDLYLILDETDPNAIIMKRHNQSILIKLNSVLDLISMLYLQSPSMSTNKFYDMVDKLLFDLEKQKGARYQLTSKIIKRDTERTIVQIRPKRKRFLGIFAKHAHPKPSIEYPIDGKQRSFLVMSYFFPQNRQPTAAYLLNSAPETVSLEFMDLGQPLRKGQPEIYSVDVMDRMELPGRPVFSQTKLTIFWGIAVGAFKGLSLIGNGQDNNNKIAIFRNNPNNPVTVFALRQRLQVLYPYLSRMQ